MIESCLYVGTVEHHRFMPVQNKFKYSVCYYYLDLDEISKIFKFPFFLGLNFPGVLSFWRKDYYGDKKMPLKESIKQLIEKASGETSSGPIRMLTNISYFGYCFNPVSFYYCFDEDGKTLNYIVSEVTNTPWKERHQQVFKFPKKDQNLFKFPKEFHVSPFMPMTIDYNWLFKVPSNDLYVLMQNRNTGKSQLIFDSHLKLKREPLNNWNIFKNFFYFPLNTFKTMAAIYYQATKLYFKKAPIYTHVTKEKDNDITSTT